MNTCGAVFGVIGVAIFTFFYLRSSSKATPIQVGYDQAVEALEKLREWSVWITGLSTASVGGLGYLIEKFANSPDVSKLTTVQYVSGYCALLFFGYAVLLSTWLFGAVPSLMQRLSKSVPQINHNDIYEMPVFLKSKLKTVRFCSLQHIYFMIGFISLSVFVYSLLSSK